MYIKDRFLNSEEIVFVKKCFVYFETFVLLNEHPFLKDELNPNLKEKLLEKIRTIRNELTNDNFHIFKEDIYNLLTLLRPSCDRIALSSSHQSVFFLASELGKEIRAFCKSII